MPTKKPKAKPKTKSPARAARAFPAPARYAEAVELVRVLAETLQNVDDAVLNGGYTPQSFVAHKTGVDEMRAELRRAADFLAEEPS